MPEEIKTYRSRDGVEFEKMTNAGFREQILDAAQAVKNAREHLNKLKGKCQHEEYKYVDTSVISRDTGKENGFGTGFKTEQVKNHTYLCKCCGAHGSRWGDHDTIHWVRWA